MILLGKDTCIAFTEGQARYLEDHYILGLDECNERSNALQGIVDSCAHVVTLQGVVIDDLREELRLSNDKIRSLTAIQVNNSKQIAQLEKKGKLTAFERDVVLVGAVVLGVLLLK